jgi:hypothetical protein
MALQLYVTVATRGSVLAIVAAALALAACDPFGLPATRALEDGAARMLGPNGAFELSGGYTADGGTWQMDLTVDGSHGRHVAVTKGAETLEAIVIGHDAYYRGRQFLEKQVSGNPLGASLAQAAGNAWWKGSPGQAPTFPDFTDGATFRATFLGSAATTRNDHPSIPGAVELSGARADVYISSAPPYPLVRVDLKKGVAVDGVTDAILQYRSSTTHVAAPTDLIDFGNLTTLPPIYTVVSVDTTRCTSPCTVSATLKNLGGTAPAQKPAQVEFVMRSAGSTGATLGSCVAVVQADVGYNSTTTVSCTIDAQAQNGAEITATPQNSSRA